MHRVTEVPFPGPRRTRLWVSDAAAKQIDRFRRKGDSPVIRKEWDDVYRIGIKGSEFRILGFYDSDDKTGFIAIEAFIKGGQKLRSSERQRVDAVARVKRDGDWKKVSYPRLAE